MEIVIPGNIEGDKWPHYKFWEAKIFKNGGWRTSSRFICTPVDWTDDILIHEFEKFIQNGESLSSFGVINYVPRNQSIIKIWTSSLLRDKKIDSILC